MPVRFPRSITKTISVYHLPTTAGSKQPYPGTADATIIGAFLPLDRYQHALEGDNFTDPFEIYVSVDADVRVGDKLIISSINYYVKKIFNADFGGLRHK